MYILDIKVALLDDRVKSVVGFDGFFSIETELDEHHLATELFGADSEDAHLGTQRSTF